jgi:hypothetical protein
MRGASEAKLRLSRGLSLGALCFGLVGICAAQSPGMVTILEGDALIVRGAGRLRAAEGVRLAAGDIVETGGGAFAQIELNDQTVLELGGGTRMMIGGSARLKNERQLYAMSGWFKISNTRKDANARGFELRSPLFEMTVMPPVVVASIKPAEAQLFAERGDSKLTERQAGASAGPVTVKFGQYYRRPAGTKGTLSGTAPAGFVADMPRPFRDSLPLRADKFKDRDVLPRPASDFVYADVEAWLKSESPMRRQFVERWRVKARDSAFRAALIANLSSHPEWDPVLFPEKYLPKDPASAASAPRQRTSP